MPKTEVYSWRLEAEIKRALEEHAARRGLTLAQLLDAMAQDWLQRRAADGDGPAHIRSAARRWIGSISGGGEPRSERVRALVRERLKERRARNRPR